MDNLFDLFLQLQTTMAEYDHDKAKQTYDAIISLLGMIQEELEHMPEATTITEFIKSDNWRNILDRLKAEGGPHVDGKRVNRVNYPIDKISGDIFNFQGATKEPIQFAMEKATARKPITTYVGIDFTDLPDNVKITRQLQPYDKRVYLAVSALWAAGNRYITARQIFHAMGLKGKPAPNQIESVNTALSKLSATRLRIDNTEEAEKYKYPRFVYDAPLLPMERVTATVNGKLVESAVHLFREPPMATYARERKQVTAVSIKTLGAPINMTNQNVNIEDYLLTSIARIQSGNRNPKILYNTLFDHVGVKDKKQRQRSKEVIERIMNHFRECEYVKGFAMERDGIKITV